MACKASASWRVDFSVQRNGDIGSPRVSGEGARRMLIATLRGQPPAHPGEEPAPLGRQRRQIQGVRVQRAK